jgi:hypothetical protein
LTACLPGFFSSLPFPGDCQDVSVRKYSDIVMWESRIVVAEIPDEVAGEVKLLKPASLTATAKRRRSAVAPAAQDVSVLEKIDPGAGKKRASPGAYHPTVEVDEIGQIGTHRSKERVAGTGAVTPQTQSSIPRRSLPEDGRDDSQE